MIIDSINQFIIDLITNTGYIGILLAMLVEGVFTPLPSEMIMPFAGYVAYTGELNFILVIIVGSVGAVIGSFIAYLLASHIGRPLVDRFGKYIGLDQEKLDAAERWFKKWGVWGIFIGHSLPGIRSIISFPAGRAKMDRLKFVTFTFLGAMVWNTVLVSAGYLLGEDWIEFWKSTDGWDYVILGLLGVILVVYYVHLRRKKDKLTRSSDSE
ncbi:MAG: DedA family protein, partial [Methanomassiliicoccales archaeon]|nr:DedA family protein [Methanomassiliicoccales archaeon]